MKISKKLLALIIFISGVVGFFVVLPVHYALEKTSGDKFCVVCHEMDPMVLSYQNDVHAGKGKTGVKAKCVDCHLPHDNLVKYVYQKAKNGLVEGYVHFFGEPDKIDWHANRKNKERYVFDNGCTSCHENILDNKLLSAQAQKMHAHYANLKGTPKELKCVSCHVGVGHNNDMRNYLEYWKPTYKLYEKKMIDKKIQLKKDAFGAEYEPTAQEQEHLQSKEKDKVSSH